MKPINGKAILDQFQEMYRGDVVDLVVNLIMDGATNSQVWSCLEWDEAPSLEFKQMCYSAFDYVRKEHEMVIV